MTNKITITIILGLFSLGLVAQNYIGSNKCKSCHQKEEKGAQFKKWKKTPHSKAFETLKSEQAKKIATKMGLAEAPHKSPKCLVCHTTGYGKGGYELKDEAFWNYAKDDKAAKKAAKRMKGLQAVGCESCHGPGSKYKSKKVMREIYEGNIIGADLGLWEPNEKNCVECHNEDSPTYKPFNFEDRLEEVQHPFPEGMK